MTELAQRLNLAPQLTDRIALLENKKVEILAKRCISNGFHILKKENDIVRLAVILNLAVKVRKKYIEAGIEDRVYYDTMSDIRIWCERNNNKGLKNYGWLKNHVSFELFRLGRLQFQLYECKNKTLPYNKLPFSYGEKLVYIHIPEGEKLEKEKCIDAIKQAGEFFDTHFPDYNYKYYFCESWLLFEGNRDFMAEGSNILNFMALFDVRCSVKIDAQAIERIFGKRCIIKRHYPENTDLQKRAKKYIQSGNCLGIGIGTIKR